LRPQVWNTQAFSHLKTQGKSPSQISCAAATLKYSDGAWVKVLRDFMFFFPVFTAVDAVRPTQSPAQQETRI
jgi:hypothetical protein